MRRFIFSLARELKMPVGEMLNRMSSYELTEWQAYLQLEEQRMMKDELARKSKAGVMARKVK